jgi:hypothetical protein
MTPETSSAGEDRSGGAGHLTGLSFFGGRCFEELFWERSGVHRGVE